MADIARGITGQAGYRVPYDDPSFKGADAHSMRMLQERLARGAETGSGHFRLDVEQMRAFLPQWQELRDKLDDLRSAATNLIHVAAPAADQASVQHNQAAIAHAQLYAKSIKDQWAYADGYVNSLKKMIADYEATDSASADTLKNLGTALS